jgi:hypothetical protein
MALFQRLQAIFQSEDVENWRGCFVVATEHKIRIRRPTGSSVRESRAVYRAGKTVSGRKRH